MVIREGIAGGRLSYWAPRAFVGIVAGQQYNDHPLPVGDVFPGGA